MDEYDVSGGYIPSFVQHLADTRARLGIGIRPQVGDDPINEGSAVGEATDVHVPSSWTPAEHDAFFRALSVYSRWRPDLIAACVRTRTEWEVWMYLEALDEGAATLAMEQSDEDVEVEMQVDDGPSVGSGSRSDADEVCEPALEVSQAWVDLEERVAAWIVREEHLASVEGDAAGDTADMVTEPQKRKRGRPRGTGRARVQAVVKEGSPLRARCSSSPEPTLTTARIAQEREGLMGRLEVPHLLVLDSILRESEEAGKDQEDAATGGTLTEFGDEGALDGHDVREPSPPDQTVAPQGTISARERSSNVVIDPVLLALSGDVGSGGLASFASSHVPAQGSTLSRHVSQPAALEAPSQPGPSTAFTFPSDDTTHTPPCPPASGEPDLTLFSPRSRRRIQKRLYMRRKRAQMRDNNAAPEGAIGTGIQKLRPGKKAKPEQAEAPVVSTSVACSEAASDGDGEGAENVVRKNKGGLTLPYKLKARFAKLGVDATYLGGQGMDLLNLGALGKRMGLRPSLEHDTAAAAIAQSIDAQLIRHLQAAVVSFVTDVAHRAIVWREREVRLKQRGQAWRQGNHVTVAAIEHAVEAVGAAYLEERLTSPSADAAEGAKASFADPDVEATDRSPELPRLAPHRDVYAPLIRPSPEWRVGALACFTRTYEREATRTRRGASADVGEEELMSDETDEEALDAELGADAAVDGADGAAAAAAEGRLWEGMKPSVNLGAG